MRFGFCVLVLSPWFLVFGSLFLGLRSWVLGLGSWILGLGSSVLWCQDRIPLDPYTQDPNPAPNAKPPNPPTPKNRSRSGDGSCSIFVFFFGAGRWVLGAGFWALGVSAWCSVLGHTDGKMENGIPPPFFSARDAKLFRDRKNIYWLSGSFVSKRQKKSVNPKKDHKQLTTNNKQ